MWRLNLTNSLAAQRSLHALAQQAASMFFTPLLMRAPLIRLSFISLPRLFFTLLLATAATVVPVVAVNAATEQLTYHSLDTYPGHLNDTAGSGYLIPQMSLIQFSTIFIKQSEKPADELPRRKVSTQTEAYNRSIELLVSTGEFVTPRATINLLNPNASHGYSPDSTEPYRSGGSALGEVLRMGLKSWWNNNEGSQLHAISAVAPESVRTGKVAGKAKFDWDYSLKFSYDDVKLKFEKAF